MKNALDEVRTGGLNRLWQAMVCLWLRCPHRARYEFEMGIERLLNSGDYAPGGHYDTILPGWRDPDCDCRRIAWNLAVAPTEGTTAALIEAAAVGSAIAQTPPAAV